MEQYDTELIRRLLAGTPEVLRGNAEKSKNEGRIWFIQQYGKIPFDLYFAQMGRYRLDQVATYFRDDTFDPITPQADELMRRSSELREAWQQAENLENWLKLNYFEDTIRNLLKRKVPVEQYIGKLDEYRNRVTEIYVLLHAKGKAYVEGLNYSLNSQKKDLDEFPSTLD